MVPKKQALEDKLDNNNPLTLVIPSGFSDKAVMVYDLKFGFLGTFAGRVLLTVVFISVGFLTGLLFWSDVPYSDGLVVPPSAFIPGIFFTRGLLFIPEAIAEK